MFLYIVSWLQFVDGVAPAQALGINTASMAAMIPAGLAAGWLADRIGRKRLLLAALTIAFVSAVPLLWLMYHHRSRSDPRRPDGLRVHRRRGARHGARRSWSRRRRAEIRCTAISVGYNVTFGVVGGLTPLAATWLVHRTDIDLSPAFMVMVAAAISFVAALSFKETNSATRATLDPTSRLHVGRAGVRRGRAGTGGRAGVDRRPHPRLRARPEILRSRALRAEL